MLWKGFQRPKVLECDQDTLTDQYGRFHAQPFERGFGTTIGNALRRVLLSSIEGAAVTAVKIDGVLHEFSPIQGVVEDATDLILNLKQIPIRIHVDEAKTLLVRAEKPGEVKAGDIRTDADVDILDPGVHLATVADGGSLNVELRVKRGARLRLGRQERGRGPGHRLDSGRLRAFAHQEGQLPGRGGPAGADYRLRQADRGCVDGRRHHRARRGGPLGAQLIRDHLSIFISVDDSQEQPAEPDEDPEQPAPVTNEHLDKSVDELELSVRSSNCLKNANIRTIRELVQKSEPEMLRTKNFGRKSLNEIKLILTELGLGLGMRLDQPSSAPPSQSE